MLRCRGLAGAPGLYVGCGNGRNYVPLLDAGLDLQGLDVSAEALAQLAARRPAARLVHADFLGFEPPAPLRYLIAIQIFQHGTLAETARYFAHAGELLVPGGLVFLRVNAASTEIFHHHAVTERDELGGFTVQYLDGPKTGLPVHFYARGRLDALTREAFDEALEPREQVNRREPPKTGSWTQWEAVYRKR